MNQLIEESGNKIILRNEGGKEIRPEEVGVPQLMDGSAKTSFLYWLDNWSDIQGHLFTLFKAGCGNVLELGVRGGVSTAALLYGVEKHGGNVWSVDFDPRCWQAFDGHPQWNFICADTLDFDSIRNKFPKGIVELDILFIDSSHKYDRLKKELTLWVPHLRTGGRVLIHDVFSFPDMAKAAEEYAAEYDLIYTTREGSNGLGILRARLH